jgi:hypothetical protein
MMKGTPSTLMGVVCDLILIAIVNLIKMNDKKYFQKQKYFFIPMNM